MPSTYHGADSPVYDTLRAVKPDATDDEIRAAWDDSQGGAQIFSQAVSYNRPAQRARADACRFIRLQLVSSRTQGARAAFAEVQSRNQDLRKIEETITQLAQMMQDVSGACGTAVGRKMERLSLMNRRNQMATLVLEQDESVRMIETQAVQVNTDVENGYVRAMQPRLDCSARPR